MNNKHKYDIVILDFDNTLCNSNLYELCIKINDIDKIKKLVKINNKYRHVSSLFNNYDQLICIFNDLKKRNVKLCIATLNYLKLITKMVNTAFPNIFDYILTPDNIDIESGTNVTKITRFLIDSSCPRFYGKNVMIKTIMKKFNINDPSKIIFFDDDCNNTKCAQSCINIDIINNDKTGITSNLLLSTLYQKKNNISSLNINKLNTINKTFIIYKF